MKNILFTTILVAGTSIALNAQLIVNAEFRPRGEIRHGYKSLFSDEDKSAYFVSQRTRLGVNFTQEKYSLSITGPDVRIWGDESVYNQTSVKGDEASVELFEANLQIKFWHYTSIKLGRQQWVYDDQRLLSARNWGQTGIAYDGILFKYDDSNFRTDIGLSINNDKENKVGNEYTPDKMKFLDFVYLSKKLGQSSFITFMGIISGYQKDEGSETIYASATYGPYFKINQKKIELESSFFHQSGTNIKSQSINAYLFSLNGLYKFTDKFSIGPGIDFVSGNDPSSSSDTDYSFDILYGGRHRFLGDMDYFTNLSNSVLDAGIVDLFVKANLALNKRNNVNFTYHHFSTHKNITDPIYLSTNLKKYLGDEFDIMYKYKAEMPAELKVGISLYNATRSMEVLQDVDGNASKLQFFTYVQLAFSPNIFTSQE